MSYLETLYTKNFVNELIFLLVTHTTCFNIRFDHYRILKLGFSYGQILDRLGIPVPGHVFRPQDLQNMLLSEYKIWR
jgi:hypothetical protein